MPQRVAGDVVATTLQHMRYKPMSSIEPAAAQDAAAAKEAQEAATVKKAQETAEPVCTYPRPLLASTRRRGVADLRIDAFEDRPDCLTHMKMVGVCPRDSSHPAVIWCGDGCGRF